MCFFWSKHITLFIATYLAAIGLIPWFFRKIGYVDYAILALNAGLILFVVILFLMAIICKDKLYYKDGR
jgi:hypothetical protein